MKNLWLAAVQSLVLPFLFQASCWAHAVGESYVWLNVAETHLEGRIEINIEQLDKLELGTTTDDPSAAVQSSIPAVQRYVNEHLQVFAADRPVELKITRATLFDGEGFHFGQYYFKSPEITIGDELLIKCDLFFEFDSFHRNLLLMEFNKKTAESYGDVFIALIFSPYNIEQTLDLLNVKAALTPIDFIWQGILHIWIGIDHILFLVVLLLPAVLVREDGVWRPVTDVKTAMWNILKIVTVFTIAHSITLSLAALEIIELPSRFVESTIALSIILVSLNVLFPKFRDGSLYIIFFFGLFHGLGFASVMGVLPYRITDLVKVLLGFNVGVEFGQIAIVACVFPIIFLLRKTSIYRPLLLHGGAIVICLIATYWFFERVLAL